jgi:hypothetical protein
MRLGVPCSARKNADLADTRAACCTLCVTITMVTYSGETVG